MKNKDGMNFTTPFVEMAHRYKASSVITKDVSQGAEKIITVLSLTKREQLTLIDALAAFSQNAVGHDLLAYIKNAMTRENISD